MKNYCSNIYPFLGICDFKCDRIKRSRWYYELVILIVTLALKETKKKDESNQISQVIVRLGPYQNRKGARNWTTILITGICDLINP